MALAGRYPKLAALLDHKHALTSSPLHSIPPTYLNLSSSNSPASTETTHPSPMSLALTETLTSTSSSSVRFDSILLTPPPSTTYEELKSLDLGRVAANPGFVWLWVGSGQSAVSLGGEGDGSERGQRQDGIGLEKGRELLSLWGYRRCEDIVWLKTNKRDPEADLVREVSLPLLFLGSLLAFPHSPEPDADQSPLREYTPTPTAHLAVHADDRALPDGHPWHRPALDRLVPRPLQRRYRRAHLGGGRARWASSLFLKPYLVCPAEQTSRETR